MYRCLQLHDAMNQPCCLLHLINIVFIYQAVVEGSEDVVSYYGGWVVCMEAFSHRYKFWGISRWLSHSDRP